MGTHNFRAECKHRINLINVRKGICKITVKCLEVLGGETLNVFKKRQGNRFSFLKVINGCKIK